MKEIAIRKGAVQSAAMWVKIHNHYLRNSDIDYLEAHIQEHVDTLVKKAKKRWELTYISSGGWTVIFLPEDDNYGTIEVLVDVQVGQEIEYDYI